MENYNFWNYLSTKVLTSEADDILCVGETLPEDVIGNVFSIDKNDPMPGKKFDIILNKNVLNGNYRLLDHFEKMHGSLKRNGILTMVEPVVGTDDASLNTLLATIRKDHVRYFSAEEIISSGSDFFEITEFLRLNMEFVYDIPSGLEKEVEKQISSFVSDVFVKVDPVIEANKIKFSQQIGLFVWQRK